METMEIMEDFGLCDKQKRHLGCGQAIGASNEVDRASLFDNSLSFGAKQNAL